MPNSIAYVALFGWPLVAIWLFRTQSFERAIIWSVVGSFLFLPSGFGLDFPGLPPLDKVTVPSLTLLLLVLLAPKRPFRFMPKNRFGRVLILIGIASPFLTASFNGDPRVIGDMFLRGMSPYDGLSELTKMLLIVVPFLVGRCYLASLEAQREILRVLLTAGLAYSVLMLFEVRMSPHLHTWVYGYFPTSFTQQMRYGGFRPVVFLPHGLWTGFFAATVTIAAAVLWRDAKSSPDRAKLADPWLTQRYLYATGYLGTVLVLCKSLASIVYGVCLVPLVLLTKPRTQLWVATVLTLVAMTYPATRGGGLFPVDTLVSVSRAISEGRTPSLETRLYHEEMLLEHASERPFFGWGGWGRHRVFNEESGADISVTDGYWVMQIGGFGWVGFIGFFGLLALPVLAVLRQVRQGGPGQLNPITSGLCLLVAINLVEILPNSTLPPWTWLIAGALLGSTENRVRERHAAVEPRPARRPRPRTVL